jgi:WD40 repeat protein
VLNVSSAKIEGRHSTEYTGAYFSIGARLSPDNRRLYLPRSDPVNHRYSIRCLDLATGQEVWQTERGRDHVLAAFAISPDGRVLVSGSCCEDPTIRVWDTATGRLLRLLDRHTAWVCTLAFSMDGRRLISAGSDQSIRIWDTATWTELKVLRGHRDEVYGLAVSETAHLIASASKDGDLMLWNDEVEGANDGYSRVQETLLEEVLPRNGIRGVKGGVTLRENHLDSEAVPLDRSRLLMLPRDKPPELIDLNNGAFLGSLSELGSSSNVLDRVGDGTLCRWDGTNQILLEELRGGDFIRIGAIPLNSRPTGLARHAKRPLVAWSEASALKSIYLADLTAPGRRIELMGDVPGLIPYRFSTDGSYLVAVAPGRNSLRAWKLDTGKIVTSIDGDISDATFAGGGQMLVVAINTESSNEVGFYDLANPSRAPRLIPGRQHCSHLAVSPDDRLVAASIMNGSIRLFDPAKREEIEPLYRHMNAAFGIAFSPDGRRLISGGGGREAIKLWDVATRQELLTLAGTGSFIHTAIWCAEGDVILAGAPWQMWRAPSLADIEKADARDKSPARQP